MVTHLKQLLVELVVVFSFQPFLGAAAADVEVLNFCTVSSATTDNTACVQQAIDQAGLNGGGRVHFAPGTYLFKGTLNINKSNITLDCDDLAAVLNFDNGANDDFRIGFASQVVDHPGIMGCWIIHPTGKSVKTGGISLHYNNVFNGIAQNIQIENPYDGIEAENYNTMQWHSIYLVSLQDRTGNGFGIKFFRNPHLGQFADVAIITNSIIACQDLDGSGSMIGVAMDGVATLDMTHVGIVQCSTGLWIENSAGDPIRSPTAFGNFNSVEVDGAHYIGLRIDSGTDLKFQGCDAWGGVRALNISSNASLVTFSGGRMGGAAEQAAVVDGAVITFSGTVFTASSLSGYFPMVELGSHASHVLLNGVRSGPNPVNLINNASYGLRIDTGADYITVQGSDFSGNVTGRISGHAKHQAIGNSL